MVKLIHHHWELEVHKKSVAASMEIFQASKTFPKEETYSLTDQIRRSSRAVPTAIAEAWRGRKYEAVFVNKLNEAEREAAETQTWLEFAVKCGYLKAEQGSELHRACDEVLAMLVTLGNQPDKWLMRKSRRTSISDSPTH
jgi:four helix bundle protein